VKIHGAADVRLNDNAAFLRVRRRLEHGQASRTLLLHLLALSNRKRIMKTHSPLRRATPVVAALAGIGLTASVLAITSTPNLAGTPDDGMICRSGYTGAISGSAFKCSKVRNITLQLECIDPKFPTYVIRPQGATGTTVGQDLCTRNGVNLGSTDAIGNLIQGQDFINAAVDPARISTRVSNLDQEEATALGLDTKDVDTIAGQPTIQYNQGAGSRDNATVVVTHYTFAIKTGGLIAAK
jgi:hypothetical protein